MPRLPKELILEIVELASTRHTALESEYRTCNAVLTACSLLSQEYTHIFQKMLWRNLLFTRIGADWKADISRTIFFSSVLGNHATKTVEFSGEWFSEDIIHCVGQLSAIEDLIISAYPPVGLDFHFLWLPALSGLKTLTLKHTYSRGIPLPNEKPRLSFSLVSLHMEPVPEGLMPILSEACSNLENFRFRPPFTSERRIWDELHDFSRHVGQALKRLTVLEPFEPYDCKILSGFSVLEWFSIPAPVPFEVFRQRLSCSLDILEMRGATLHHLPLKELHEALDRFDVNLRVLRIIDLRLLGTPCPEADLLFERCRIGGVSVELKTLA